MNIEEGTYIITGPGMGKINGQTLRVAEIAQYGDEDEQHYVLKVGQDLGYYITEVKPFGDKGELMLTLQPWETNPGKSEVIIVKKQEGGARRAAKKPMATAKRVLINGQKRVVYKGPRGGEYVTIKGALVPLSKAANKTKK